jgi:hypothetical protein
VGELLRRFLAEEDMTWSLGRFEQALAMRTAGSEEILFNVFIIEIDVDARSVTVFDDLDVMSSEQVALDEFMLAVRSQAAPRPPN